MAPFYGWGSTASRLQPLQGGSLLFTIQFPESPGTHHLTGKTPPLSPQDNIASINWLVFQHLLILKLISCQVFKHLAGMNQNCMSQDARLFKIAV